MANCIPTSIDNLSFAQFGEKKLFNILKRLPNNCIVRYEMVLHEKNYRPDFAVLSPNFGVCIIEVKDWSADAIIQATPESFVIQWRDNAPQTRMNPQLKSHIYIANTKEKLMLSSELRDKNFNLLVNTHYLIAFPNMSGTEFDDLGLEAVIEKSHVLFREDLLDERVAIARLENAIPKMQSPLNISQFKKICDQLGVTISMPLQKDGGLVLLNKRGKVASTEQIVHEFAIDLEQEKVAKNLGEGPRLLRGLAGSGKTLILLVRAKLSISNAEELGERQRILILCWNISLANYMRQAFKSINIPFAGKLSSIPRPASDTSTVEIMHLMDWARWITNSYSSYKFPSSNQPDFLDRVSSLLENLKLPENAKYDAIYLDEAQDFREEWIEFLFNKALKGNDPKSKNFIISADNAQQIYQHQGKKGFTWADLQIPMQGRSKIFHRVYRNSARIWSFAGFLLGNIGEYYHEDDGKPSAEIWFAPKNGNDPQLVECSNIEEQIREAVTTVTNITSQGYSPRNVLILYQRQVVNGYKVVENLQRQLWNASIESDWIAENASTKQEFDWSRDAVKISTVHSAKGMDAPVVIVLNAEAFTNSDGETDELKLMYVALTRAREYLKVLYTGEAGMVPELKRAQSIYEKYKSRIYEYERRAHQSAI